MTTTLARTWHRRTRVPELLHPYGPNTALGHGGSFIFTVECQIDYVLSVLREMGKHGLSRSSVAKTCTTITTKRFRRCTKA